MILLRLYVTDATPASRRALANLRRMFDERLKGLDVEVEVIDVLERPQLAEDDRVVATPTLVRRLPTPIRRIIGDMSDLESVLVGLEMKELADEVQDEEGEE